MNSKKTLEKSYCCWTALNCVLKIWPGLRSHEVLVEVSISMILLTVMSYSTYCPLVVM